jgi:hypothetical protein
MGKEKAKSALSEWQWNTTFRVHYKDTVIQSKERSQSRKASFYNPLQIGDTWLICQKSFYIHIHTGCF